MVRPLVTSGVVLLLAACGSRAEPAAAPPDRTATEPGPAPAPQPAPTTPEPEATEPETEPGTPAVLLHIEDDLDGQPGVEVITLHADGRLQAGSYRGQAELTGGDEYFMSRQASLRVVMLDQTSGQRAVLVTLPTAETEDPPNRYQLFVIDGQRLQRVLSVVLGAYGVTELRFPGDGTARYVEDGWTACDRAGHPTRVTQEEVTLRLTGGEMREASRSETRQVQLCDELAACPAVYVMSASGASPVGEILRDLRGEDAYGLQDLPLPTTSGPLHVRLAEEKLEVTFLDEIYVELDGRRIAPRACDEPEPPAFCAADRRMHLLRTGDVVDLTFDLPAAGAATLFARGYYIPTG